MSHIWNSETLRNICLESTVLQQLYIYTSLHRVAQKISIYHSTIPPATQSSKSPAPPQHPLKKQVFNQIFICEKWLKSHKISSVKCGEWDSLLHK
jgi:hypothetical protein